MSKEMREKTSLTQIVLGLLLGHATRQQRSYSSTLSNKETECIPPFKFWIFVLLIHLLKFFLQNSLIQEYLRIFNSASKWVKYTFVSLNRKNSRFVVTTWATKQSDKFWKLELHYFSTVGNNFFFSSPQFRIVDLCLSPFLQFLSGKSWRD